MSTLRLVSLGLLSILATACGSADTADEGNVDEGAIEQGGAQTAGHIAAVGKCNKLYSSAADRAVSTADMIQASGAFGDCLKKANDAAVTLIEKNLTEAGSSYKGTTARSLAAARAASEALCDELDKASSNFGGSLSRIEATACRSDVEAFLGLLIDAHVTQGDESVHIKEARANHKTCYRKYDKRLDAAVANNDMVQATFELADCVGRRVAILATPVAKKQVENDAAAGPEATAIERVKAAAAGEIKAGSELCAVLNEAGDNGIGSLSRITTGTCSARVAESVYANLRQLIDE